ncbi:carbohydrate-binding module family 24 protein, partial [Parathielavia appendiculata]
MDVPADASYLEFSNPNYCLITASLWNIELEQLLLWNPSLPEMLNETMLDSCMLEEGFRYCVGGGGGGSIPSGSSTTLPPSSSSAVPSSSVSNISSSTTSLAPVPTPNSNCVLGTGPNGYQGLCDFSCHFGWCPSPCTCTTTGTPAPPPALLTSGQRGYAAPGEAADFGPLCDFACSRVGNYCPGPPCTTVPPATVCVEGTGTGNYEGLCSYTCGFGYCPPGPCTCLAYGTQVLPPPATHPAGVPATGLDESYSGL